MADAGGSDARRMRVDAVGWRALAVCGAVACAALVVALVVGCVGPAPSKYTTYYAYHCPGESHTWAANCSGVQLADDKQHWVQDLSPFSYYHRYWQLDMTPYDQYFTKGEEDKMDVTVVSVYKYHTGSEWEVDKTMTETVSVDCPPDVTKNHKGACETVSLKYYPSIEHKHWRVDVNIIGTTTDSFLGDVKFTVLYGTPSYTKLSLSVHVLYTAFAVVLFLTVLCFLMRPGMRTGTGTTEQRFLVVLLVLLILYNDPFYPLQNLSFGVIFEIINSFFRVSFQSVMIGLWLFAFDIARNQRTALRARLLSAGKVVLVLLYFALAFALHTWTNTEMKADVDVSWTSVTGILVFYVLTVLTFVAAVVWVCAAIMFSMPALVASRLLMRRFVFLGLPSAIYALCIMLKLFIGFGSLGYNSMDIVFFATVPNIYVAVLCFGYLPAPPQQHMLNPKIDDESAQETAPLV
eukprot:TRINITY_DN7708_c0_g1_i1.p1 TRINITY_DN7708_c0_g1~~TRINITY_DN7708_c0_g1_i1.p1  ORF type:complete len:463 (+),score=119.28 TRINITY_DN7708_c0_g1_i1:55-1443(+)